jgi:hypothetical protein
VVMVVMTVIVMAVVARVGLMEVVARAQARCYSPRLRSRRCPAEAVAALAKEAAPLEVAMVEVAMVEVAMVEEARVKAARAAVARARVAVKMASARVTAVVATAAVAREYTMLGTQNQKTRRTRSRRCLTTTRRSPQHMEATATAARAAAREVKVAAVVVAGPTVREALVVVDTKAAVVQAKLQRVAVDVAATERAVGMQAEDAQAVEARTAAMREAVRVAPKGAEKVMACLVEVGAERAAAAGCRMGWREGSSAAVMLEAVSLEMVTRAAVVAAAVEAAKAAREAAVVQGVADAAT